VNFFDAGQKLVDIRHFARNYAIDPLNVRPGFFQCMLNAQHGTERIAIRAYMRRNKDGLGLANGRDEILKNGKTPYFVL
jgi:hypothetical protein